MRQTAFACFSLLAGLALLACAECHGIHEEVYIRTYPHNYPIPPSGLTGINGLNLNTPEETLVSFLHKTAAGEPYLAQSCFFRFSKGWLDIYDTLTTGLWSNRYPERRFWESVDPNFKLEILSRNLTPSGLELVWRVTLQQPTTYMGYRLRPGSKWNCFAKLRSFRGQWFITEISTVVPVVRCPDPSQKI